MTKIDDTETVEVLVCITCGNALAYALLPPAGSINCDNCGVWHDIADLKTETRPLNELGCKCIDEKPCFIIVGEQTETDWGAIDEIITAVASLPDETLDTILSVAEPSVVLDADAAIEKILSIAREHGELVLDKGAFNVFRDLGTITIKHDFDDVYKLMVARMVSMIPKYEWGYQTCPKSALRTALAKKYKKLAEGRFDNLTDLVDAANFLMMLILRRVLDGSETKRDGTTPERGD
jgi:hypothetical protein